MKHALALLLLTACNPLTRVALDQVNGVPSATSCEPGTSACVATDAGVYPAVCSGRGRLWPDLSRTVHGVQRVCGDAGCARNDAGRAVCL